MRTRLWILVTALLVFATLLNAQGRRSAWMGVYTDAQAEKGKVEYEKNCIRCHAANLDGVQDANLLGDFGPRNSLRGADFMERWREDTAQSLMRLIKTGMPPRNEPKAQIPDITDEAVIDMMAYIFKGNGFPAGPRTLGDGDLRLIRIQGEDGSKPLPSFSVVQAVGCLNQLRPGVWELKSSAPPTRIRELVKATDEDIQAALEEPLGNSDIDLQNLGYLGRDFEPLQYEGHKVQVRGILIRQPPTIRIDVRLFIDVAESCTP